MKPEDRAFLRSLLIGLAWVAAFLLATGLGALGTCTVGMTYGETLDKRAGTFGKGLEGSANSIGLGLLGLIVGGIVSAIIFVVVARRIVKRRRENAVNPGEPR